MSDTSARLVTHARASPLRRPDHPGAGPGGSVADGGGAGMQMAIDAASTTESRVDDPSSSSTRATSRDRSKIEAYERALRRASDPGDVVVDLGAGTGCWASWPPGPAPPGSTCWTAVRSSVSPPSSPPATGFDEVMVPVRAHSQEVVLPELADVIVCDQIGGLVYDAGVLEYFADARATVAQARRPAMVPLGFELFCAPVSAPGPRGDVDVWAAGALGHRCRACAPARAQHGVAGRRRRRRTPDGARLPAVVSAPGPGNGSPPEVDFTFDAPGTVDGILGWFDAELAPGVHLSNSPGRAGRMDRWCNFYATPESFSGRRRRHPRGEDRPASRPGDADLDDHVAPRARHPRPTDATPRCSASSSGLRTCSPPAGAPRCSRPPPERRGRRGPRSCGRGHDGGRDHRPRSWPSIRGAFPDPGRGRAVLRDELGKWARVSR